MLQKKKKKEYNTEAPKIFSVCASVCESRVPCLSQAHTPPIQCVTLKRKAISISAKVRLATYDEAISFIICFSSLRCHWEAFPCLIPWKCISLHSHPLFAAVAHRSWSSAASGTFTMWNSMGSFLWSSTHILRVEKSHCVFWNKDAGCSWLKLKGSDDGLRTIPLRDFLFSSLLSGQHRLDWHIVSRLEANVGFKSNIWQYGNRAFVISCYSKRIFSYSLLSFLRRNGISWYSTLSAPTHMHTFAY